MTAPAAGAVAGYLALDAAYRAAIARTSLAVLEVLGGLWSSVDPTDLSGSTENFLDGSVRVIMSGQRSARQLADLYADRVRALSVPNAPALVLPPPRPPNVEQLRTSIEFVAIKKTARDLYALNQSTEPGDEATPAEREAEQRTREARQRQLMQEAIQRAAGAAIRHVTTAGRDRLEDVVQEDRIAIGWVRTTKPGCCYFCAMLASRGVVYKEDSFRLSNELFEGIGNQKVHDHCGCGLRPMYLDTDPLPDRVNELDTMWGESQKQKRPSETPINAFRRIYEASPLAQPANAA